MAFPVQSRGRLRYLGNDHTKEVHDLIAEKTECQVDEIIANNQAVRFDPDTLEQAHREGFRSGPGCLARSRYDAREA